MTTPEPVIRLIPFEKIFRILELPGEEPGEKTYLPQRGFWLTGPNGEKAAYWSDAVPAAVPTWEIACAMMTAVQNLDERCTLGEVCWTSYDKVPQHEEKVVTPSPEIFTGRPKKFIA